jgi:hypothetical protein
MSPNKLQPALFGGLFIGVLSALPLVNVANCCCLWMIAGGVLAAYVMQQGHPLPISLGDGALAGLLAGIIGAVVYLVAAGLLAVTLGPFMHYWSDMAAQRSADLPPEMRDLMRWMGRPGVGLAVGFVFQFFFGTIFATIGGLLGAAIFKKPGPPASPPPGPPPVPVDTHPTHPVVPPPPNVGP